MTAGGQDAAADLVTRQLLALEDDRLQAGVDEPLRGRGGGQAGPHHDHVDLARHRRPSRQLRQMDDRDAQGAREGLAVALALHHHSRRPAAFGDDAGQLIRVHAARRPGAPARSRRPWASRGAGGRGWSGSPCRVAPGRRRGRGARSPRGSRAPRRPAGRWAEGRPAPAAARAGPRRRPRRVAPGTRSRRKRCSRPSATTSRRAEARVESQRSSRLEGRARPTSRPRARSRPSSSATAAPRPRWRRIAVTTPGLAARSGPARSSVRAEPATPGPARPRRHPRLAGPLRERKRVPCGQLSAQGEGHPDRVDALRADGFARAAEHAGLERGAQGLGGGAALQRLRSPHEGQQGIARLPPHGAGEQAERAAGAGLVAGPPAGQGFGRHQKITSRFRTMPGSAASFRARWRSTTSSPRARRM